METSTKKPKPINIDHVCQHLTWLFNSATSSMGHTAVKGSKLYDYQVEFCYFINEIKRGHTYIVPKVIADCNEFINGILANNKTSKK